MNLSVNNTKGCFKSCAQQIVTEYPPGNQYISRNLKHAAKCLK